MAIPIGTLGTIPTLTVAGRVFTDLTTLIVANAPIEGGTGVKTTFRKQSAGGGYQVTTGKTLTVSAMAVAIGIANINTFDLLYSDNDVGQVGSTGFTNGVWLTGRGAFSQSYGAIAATGGPAQYAIYWQIPALKYPGTTTAAGGGGLITIFGYEA